MRLEFLPDGAPERPLIRLYEFERAEVHQLRDLVKALSIGSRDNVPVHKEPGVEAVGSCQLHLRLGTNDQGIRQTRTGQFECVLSSSTWEKIEGLLQPFCESDTGGFQWLSEHGDIALLISRDGEW